MPADGHLLPLLELERLFVSFAADDAPLWTPLKKRTG